MAALVVAVIAADGPVFVGRIRNFTVSPGFYPPPNEHQMKSQLKSAEAQPLTNGSFLITGVLLETFEKTGAREITLETPGCIYDAENKTVRSGETLRVATADGKFSISGTGFFWQQTNSALVISNSVRTLIDPAMIEARRAPSSPALERLEIQSQKFSYSADSGLGRYAGDVSVSSSNVLLQSQFLTFSMPFQERQMREITAEENVRMRYNEMTATGQKATYSVASGVAQVTGRPVWTTPEQEGSADLVTIHRLESLIEAQGNAQLKMAGKAVVNSPFSQPRETDRKQPAPPETNALVFIDAGGYRFWTNRAEFREAVIVRDFVGSRLRSKLQSDSLDATFDSKKSFRDLKAEGHVLIEQYPEGQEDPVQFTAQQADFSNTNSVLELTGSPAWRSGERRGSGTLIRLDAPAKEMSVVGSAQMVLPAGELTTADLSEKPLSGMRGTNTLAWINSNEYHLNQDGAVFTGGVAIRHPQLQWNCETLSVVFPEAGGRVDRMLAEGKVRFELLSRSGQKLNGSAERAFYRTIVDPAGTNDFLELTGNPVLTSTNGTFRGDVLVLDVSNQKLVAPQNFRIEPTIEGVRTNALRLPRNKLFR